MKPYYQDDAVTIYHGDCRKILPTLESETVDLVMTSPPYNAGKDYGIANDRLNLSDYWNIMSEVAHQSYACARPGAFANWNVPMWSGSRPKVFMPHDFISQLGNAQWVFKDWITWVKGSEGGVETGSTGWGNYPTTPAIRSGIEPILIFRKDGGTPRDIDDISWQEWVKFTVGVWHFNGERASDHPAPFPLKLPMRLAKLYSARGELILDPFMGSGTTLRAAKDLGRKAIGIEIEEKYCEIAAKRMSQSVMDLAL